MATTSLSNTGTLTINAGPAFGGTIDEIFLNGGSVAINGTSADYINVPASNGTFDATVDFTFETFIFWLGLPTAGPNNIFGNNSVTSTYELQLGATTVNTWSAPYKFKLSIVGTGDVLVGNTTIYQGQWYHLAHTRTNGLNKLFVNGILQTSTYTDATSRPYGANSTFVGQNSNCYVSNLRFIKGTSLYLKTFVPPAAPLTVYSTNTSVLLNTNFWAPYTDSGANVLPVASTGTTSASSLSPFNNKSWSTYFNGTTDYLSTPYNVALNLVSGDFIIEAWVYWTGVNVTGTIIDKDGVFGSTYSSYNFSLVASKIAFAVGSGNGFTYFQQITSASTLPTNQWIHVAAVKSGTTLTLYQNGVSVATATQTGTIISGGKALLVGYQAGQPTAMYWSGYISNLRVVNGTALYTSAFNPSNSPLVATTNTSLLTLQNNTIIDNSSNAFVFTSNGTPVTTTSNPFANNVSTTSTLVQRITSSTLQVSSGIDEVFLANNSVRLNGTTDYLTAPSNATYAFGTGDFTVEVWVYQTADNTYPSIFEIGSHTSATGIIFISKYTGNATIYSGGFVGTAATTLNQWNHIAWVRKSGVLTIFVNGVANTPVAFTNNLTDTSIVTIGCSQTGAITKANYYLPGNISNLRVTKGTALYTSNFTTPVAPLLPVTSSTFLLSVQTNTNRINDATIYNTSLTRVGTPLVSTTGPFSNVAHRLNKTGSVQVANYFNELPPTGSISFNGTTDYLTIPASTSSFAIGLGDFTVEMWIYPTSFANSPIIISYGGTALDYSAANGIQWLIQSNTSRQISPGINTGGGTANTFNSTNTVNLNTWTHVAMVRFGSTLYLYLNGISSGSASTTGAALTSAPTFLSIGTGDKQTSPSGAGHDFTGYISNVRIVKGTALYTGNFIVPTSPLSLPTTGYTSLLLSTPYYLSTSTAAFVDYSINPNTITKVGSPTSISTNPFKL